MTNQSKTLAQTTADKILSMIREHPYQPGEKLPTEPELCQEFSVGRNTLREALKLLASKNIVAIRQGSGSFVSEKMGIADDPFGFSMVADRQKLIDDLLQVRILVEPPIAALAAQNATAEDIARLEAILLQLEETINRKEDYALLDVKYHIRIAECTHNNIMTNLIPIIENGITVFTEEIGEPEYEQTLRSHRRIFSCIRRHDPINAQLEMQFHLQFNNQRYDIHLDR